jgi:hypothetical protein
MLNGKATTATDLDPLPTDARPACVACGAPLPPHDLRCDDCVAAGLRSLRHAESFWDEA